MSDDALAGILFFRGWLWALAFSAPLWVLMIGGLWASCALLLR